MTYDERIASLLLMYAIARRQEPHEERPFTEVKDWIMETVKPIITPTRQNAWQPFKCACGNAVMDDSNYCRKCGAKLNWREAL